jgi:inosose dehydratase
MASAAMYPKVDRRKFLLTSSLAAAIVPRSLAQPKRKLKIGHTGITWGYTPQDAATAIPEVASLGYYGYETFGEYFEAWEPKGGLKKLLDENRLPLISAYCNVNLTDPPSGPMRSPGPYSGPSSSNRPAALPQSSARTA